MKNKNESVKKLEVGKDYANVHDNSVIVIDRTEDFTNRGFEGREYKDYLSCSTYSNWREATEEEVVEAFEKHLIHRYGEDWETMKIKEKHPDLYLEINNGSWEVEITKNYDGWAVWNKNGLLYRDGIWVERLEEKEEPKIHIKDAIKENTAVHCETEEEAINKKEKEKEIMKEYRLKQWYPTLAISWRTDDRYEYDADRQVMTNISNVKNGLAMPKEMAIKEHELHPDFWELIEEKEPLFVTEDGFEVFDSRANIIVVNKRFEKLYWMAYMWEFPHSFHYKVFKHESNADTYIWKNNPLFSYVDFMEMYLMRE